MKISNEGLSIIKHFEGMRLIAYRDAVNVLTIGYGHTGPDVTEGMKITEEQAEDLLRQDVERFEVGTEGLTAPVTLTQNEFDALVSFSFNVGLGALGESTLLKKLKAGNARTDVASEFLRWNKAGGKELAGLTRRRQAEHDHFLKTAAKASVTWSIVAKHDTWLKRLPVQSSTLSSEEKLFCQKGAVWRFRRLFIEHEDNYMEVTLLDDPDATGKWYAYIPHFDIVFSGSPK